MTEIIDAHHHFWTYQSSDFPWISSEMGVIARDFFPDELQREIQNAKIDGTVAVQARQTLQETEWLLSLAKKHAFLRGVVGWAPVASDSFPSQLEKFGHERKLKGLRHVIQDEPDENFILRGDFNRGICSLSRTGLVYDILIFARHLPAAIQFVDRHPNQVFVLDHIAKPAIKEAALEPWRAHIRQIAERKNVFCKISGLVTEANWSAWRPEDLQPYLDIVLEAFGPARLMAGSDWPVCLVATTYSNWFATLHNLFHSLSASEKGHIFGGVASRVYRLQEVKMSAHP